MTPSRALLLLIVLLGGLVDLPRLLAVGPLSGLALLTIVYVVLAWLLLSFHPASTRMAVSVSAPFALFLLWGLGTLTWSGPTSAGMAGLQNLLVILAFLGGLLLAAREGYQDPRSAVDVGRRLAQAVLLASALYAIALLETGLASPLILGPRSFGLFALLGLAWYVAGWRYGSRVSLWTAISIEALIGLSLSRLAFVVGMILFPMAMIRSGRVSQWVRLAVCALLAVGVLAAAIQYFEPLRSRFFEGDLSLGVGGVAVNASGRQYFWYSTLDSFWESPWIGKGAGTAQTITGTHPHNDYLRILHDYGVVGFACWMVGFGLLLRATWRAWVRADAAGDRDAARLHLAAFIASVATALGMTTDNPMVYVFVMAPLGILAGASLGLASASRARSRLVARSVPERVAA